MKHLLIATAFAVATLTACSHKPAPVVTDSKVVKAPAKCCKKAAKKVEAKVEKKAEKK